MKRFSLFSQSTTSSVFSSKLLLVTGAYQYYNFHSSVRFCSSEHFQSAKAQPKSEQQQKQTQKQQQEQVPEILKQFDQGMRTIPQWRQLYPKLLTSIVQGEKEEAISAVSKMIELASTSSSSSENVKSEIKVDEKQQDQESSDEKVETTIDKNKLNLIVVDVAFADMFFAEEKATTTSSTEESSTSKESNNSNNELKEEEADEEILSLFLTHLGEDFKKQKARIAQFILSVIEQERDSYISQNNISRRSEQNENENENNNSGVEENKNSKTKNKSKPLSGLPNLAITITPPIDAENNITARNLLNRIHEELEGGLHHLLGGKSGVLNSICRRLVFSGAITNTENSGGSDKQQVEELTEKLFEQQQQKEIEEKKLKPQGLFHFPEKEVNEDKKSQRQKLACRWTVENDIVLNRKTSSSSKSRFLRYDIGVGENFTKAIGLENYNFDSEEEMEKASNEIATKLCQRMNECFHQQQQQKNNKEDETNNNINNNVSLEEYPILPFSFTMRCLVL